MAVFGESSRKKLDTCHPDLITLCDRVIDIYDFTVLEGSRSDSRQEELFRQGKSKLRAGQSKHNRDVSMAVDIAPYPIDWDNAKRFYLLAGMMFHCAGDMGLKIRWGGDWDNDWVHTDQSLHDLPHFELGGA
ncbi:MAG: M15 family metallopeptidase [Rhodospirillales bacterium]